MLKLLFLLLLIPVSYVRTESAVVNKRQTVDKIIAIIYMPEGISVISQSDLRPGIDGVPRDLKDIVLSRMMLLDAKKLKMDKDGKDNDQKGEDDKYLRRIQEQHKLTHEDIVKLFKDMGYTYQEGLAELRSMRLIDNVLDQRVRSKIMIDKKDVESYCAAHPIYKYKITQAMIPLDARSTKKEQHERIDKAIASGEITNSTEWIDPVELLDSQIAAEKAFIKNMAIGTVTKIEESDQEIKLLRLLEKNAIPCEERTKEVHNVLGRDRFEKALEKYHADLWAQAHVRYIDSKPLQTLEKNSLPSAHPAPVSTELLEEERRRKPVEGSSVPGIGKGTDPSEQLPA